MRAKYRGDLAGLLLLDPQALARLLKGEVLPQKPYASIRWMLRFTPFRPLELYYLLDEDPEHGTDLHIYYARKSLTVPTEDAYVFGWDYLGLLARYGRGTWPLEDAVPSREWLPFEEFAGAAATPLQEVSIGAREEVLRLLTLDVVEVALRRLETGEAAAYSHGWEAVFPILGDLAMRLRVVEDRIGLAFDAHGAQKYPPEFLMSFNWLYLNALIRECRQVNPELPKLSRYF